MKQQILNLIKSEVEQFNAHKSLSNIVPNSIPILYFGELQKYLSSDLKIITVSLNPSDIEFKPKPKSSDPYATEYRFPQYDLSINSLYDAYNAYFTHKPYGAWFKASFGSVLKSFDASHYPNANNTALHTDIGSTYATNPTWSKLDPIVRQKLEPMGSSTWHALVKMLEPDIILFSASPSFEGKIRFPQIGEWREIDVAAKRPLLSGKFQINNKQTPVLFQVQGRRPFLQTGPEEKLNFKNHI